MAHTQLHELQSSYPPRAHKCRALSTSRCRRYPTVAVRAARVSGLQWQGPPALIAGAGIAGLATALALHRVGIPVRVLEAATTGKRAGEGAAIGLWENAWVALDALGVAEELRGKYLRLDKVELCRDHGRVLRGFGFSETDAGKRSPRTHASSLPGPAGSEPGAQGGAGSEFRGVARADLLQALMAALPPGTVVPNARVVRVHDTGSSSTGTAAVVSTEDGRKHEGGLLVGCDGVRSVVTAALGLAPAKYSGYIAYRGVCTLPGGIKSIGLPPDTIRQVWGQGVRAGMYPMTPDQLYWFTCSNADETAPPPDGPEAMQQEAQNLVAGWAWGLRQVIAATPADAISRSRIVDRWTVGPLGRGLTTLCGDAAHPQTPNLGQGGCVALEDAVVLARNLGLALTASDISSNSSSSSRGVEEALRLTERERQKRCLPLVVRSNLMGAALQLPYDPVCMVRDAFVSSLFSPSHFLDHTTYDCGTLPMAARAPSQQLTRA